MRPTPPSAPSSMDTTCASQAPYGRYFRPGTGLFVTVTTVPATLTPAGHPQNGSVTLVPETAAVEYVVRKSVAFIVNLTGTDSKSGFTKIFEGSEIPYPNPGGTTIVFVSPTARPSTPLSKPFTTVPAPTVNGSGAQSPCHAKEKAFPCDALSWATERRLVSNTRPSSRKVPT